MATNIDDTILSTSIRSKTLDDVIDEIWKKFDKNQDGLLDKTETRRFFKATLGYGAKFSEEAFQSLY